MGLCDSYISRDITINCDSNQARGLEEDGIIINRNHVDFAKTVFGDKNNLIKTLVLKSGYRGYEVRSAGATPYTGTTTSMVKGTYKNTWNSTLPIVILANSPEVVEEIIEGLANGTFVVILRNKTKGEGEYQIYGYHQGLMAETIENDKYSEETDGGWLATLQETGSPKAAMFLWNTDGETTASMYESLKAEV
jgi:hypothetical protein